MTLRLAAAFGLATTTLWLSAPPALAQTTAPTAAPTPLTAQTPPPASPPDAPVAQPPEQPAAGSHFVEVTSPRALRDRGVTTQAEHDSAMADIAPSTGDRAEDATTVVVGKWSATLYGFAEADFINDSTQSFNDVAGNGQILRPNGVPPVLPANQDTYGGNNGRTQMSVRNSRLGLRLAAPEFHKIRVSGLVETDFEGYVPAPNAASGPSESQFFSSPSLRIRHAMVRIETPIVDLLVGQYWDLFGWQELYRPNSVQIQGLPGELYSRDAQVRVSHTFSGKAVSLDVAIAARRPPSRDSQMPEGQGGVRLALPWWTGVTTSGATATSVLPASVAVTGDVRQFTVPEFSATPTRSVSLSTEAVAVDAFIPVIPARHESEGNALSLNGEFVTGSGMSDLYTNFTGGLTFPTYVNTNPNVEGTATYPQDVDNGMVTFEVDNTAGNGSLHAIQWTTFLVGLQYYLPGLGGHVWVSGNFARTSSDNITQFTRSSTGNVVVNQGSYYPSNASVCPSENFFDANLFWQAVPGVRFGFEYANFNDEYGDGAHAINNRFQFSGFFIF
jgi:hypothetical protein